MGWFQQVCPVGGIIDQHQLTADRIYNCDEIGISPNQNPMLCPEWEETKVGTLSSAEGETTAIVEVCLSATATYILPLIVFARLRMEPQEWRGPDTTEVI